MGRERLDGESTEEYIARRANEVHMEEAWINDLAISPEERTLRSAQAIGLIPSHTVLLEGLTLTDAERESADILAKLNGQEGEQ